MLSRLTGSITTRRVMLGPRVRRNVSADAAAFDRTTSSKTHLPDNKTPKTTVSGSMKSMPRVPNEVLDAAEAAGATRERLYGDDLCILRMEFNDDAFKVMNEWVSNPLRPVVGEPGVHAIFAPSENIVGTALVPDHGLAVQVEANSIVNHYARSMSGDFIDPLNPVIPGPIAAPVLFAKIHHANIALHPLHQRIQLMSEPNYPVLSGLPSGSYICNIMIQWKNAIQTTTLFKP